MVRVGLGRIRVTVRRGTAILRAGVIDVTRRLFNGNNFASSAASVEVCALLSGVLIIYLFKSPTDKTTGVGSGGRPMQGI